MSNTRYLIRTLGQILFYYTWSISITFFNQWAFKSFHFPLIVSFFHMTIVFHVIWLYRTCTKVDITPDSDTVSWEIYIKRVCPTAIAASLDIGLSNWSFVFITVSMYTMCKSTSIIFILISAIIFKIEKPRLLSIVVIALIALGLFLFTFKSTSFNLFGFILVMAASCLGGFRWVLAQILLQRDSLGLSNPLEFVYYVEPIMAASLMPLSLGIEGAEMATSPDFMLASKGGMLHVLFVIAVGASLALMLTISEYLLLANTSSITLSLCGIMKEIMILTLASTVGGDKLTLTNACGLIVCLLGISLHVYLKYKDTLERERTSHGPVQLELNNLSPVTSDDGLACDRQKLIERPIND